MVFLIKMGGYQKLCDKNKNVTKMGGDYEKGLL